MSINEEKEFVCSICGRKDFKSEKALKIHKSWHNPERRINMSKKIKATWHNPERRINMSTRVKIQWQDSEFRENISEKLKAVWQNPGNSTP